MGSLFGGGGGGGAQPAPIIQPAAQPVKPGTLVQTVLKGGPAVTPQDTLIIGARETDEERLRRLQIASANNSILGGGGGGLGAGGGDSGGSVGGPAASTGAESTSADGTI